MYLAYCDGRKIFDPRIEELQLVDPVVELEENQPGAFTFTMPPSHPLYDKIQRRKSVIDVYRDKKSDESWVFSGIVMSETVDFYNQKQIICEGELTYLFDSIQRQKYYQGYSVRGLFEAYISMHNSQVEAKKQFTVGLVTVKDSNDYITCYTNMNTTGQEIKEDLLDDLGGILRVRHESGIRYIDYIEDTEEKCSQVIKLGSNLLDFESNIDMTDIATAIIPLGSKVEGEDGIERIDGLEKYTTIEAVNGGKDFVWNQDAVDRFGWIYKTVEWSDVTVPENLKRKAEKYLSDTQFDGCVIEAAAVDLHHIFPQIEELKLSKYVHVVSKIHGLNRYFKISKQSLCLNDPSQDRVTLGVERKEVTITQQSAGTKSSVESVQKQADTLETVSEETKDQIEKQKNLIVEFQKTETGLIAQVKDYQGNVSRYEQTVDGFMRQVSDYQKNVSYYEQTVSGFRSEVSDYNRNVSYYEQTVNGFTQQVSGYTQAAQNYVSQYQQTASEISARVKSADLESFIDITNKTITLAAAMQLIIKSGNFTVDRNGNVELTGKVTAEKGKIGPFKITSNGLEWEDYGTKIWANTIKTDFLEKTSSATRLEIGSSSYTTELNGKIRIGNPGSSTAAPNARIMDGGGTLGIASGSAKRFKHDISKDLGKELDPHRLYEIEIYRYKYNDDYLDKMDQRYRKEVIGFIADQIKEVYPIAVDLEEKTDPDIITVERAEQRVKDWNVRFLVPPMLALIQEQHEEIEGCKKTLKKIMKHIGLEGEDG